jgi:hypothetical protein
MSEASAEASAEVVPNPTATAPVAPEAPSTAPEENEPTAPPWGDDFNAETAWEKLQKVQAEARNLRKRVGPTPEQQEQLEEYDRLVQASKSEQQRTQEALEALGRERDQAATELRLYKIAMAEGLGPDEIGRLAGSDEESLRENAKWLADMKAKAAEQTATPPPNGRPQEQYRPGATPVERQEPPQDAYPADFLPRRMRERLAEQSTT